MSKVCLIASGKGGVGKTTVCANLGLSLARDGYRVVLIDGDMGLNNLDVVLNVESRVVYDVVDVIEGKVKIEQALLNVNNKGTLKLLASCKVNASDRISNGSFRRVVDEVSEFADIVLIDAPAGIENNFHRTAISANEAIIVTTPHLSAIRDADRVNSTLLTYNMKKVGLVVNRLRYDLLKRKEILDAESIAELLSCQLYGSIPENDKIGVYSTIDERYRNEAHTAYELLKDNWLNGKQMAKSKLGRGMFRRFFQ